MTDTCFGSMGIRDETAVATSSCTRFGNGAPTAWITRLDAVPAAPVDPLASAAPAPARPVLAPALPGPAGAPPTLKTRRRADAIVEQAGIRLELWVPRRATAVGAWLPAMLRVTNTGSVPIEHAGSVRDLVCKNPTSAWLDLSGLWPAIPHQGSAAAVAGELLPELAHVSLPVTSGLGFRGGCADFGVTERLAPGASFTVPMATWARHSLRDQPLPGGTAHVVARYRAGPIGGTPVELSVRAPVDLIGEDVTYPSPQRLVDAVLTDPAVAAFLAAHPLEAGEDCCDLQDLEGIAFPPRGHTFAELGFAGGPAPRETIGVWVAAEDGRVRVRLDPWTGEVAE